MKKGIMLSVLGWSSLALALIPLLVSVLFFILVANPHFPTGFDAEPLFGGSYWVCFRWLARIATLSGITGLIVLFSLHPERGSIISVIGGVLGVLSLLATILVDRTPVGY